MTKKTVALIILDGFGYRPERQGNAVQQAHKPNFDRYWAAYPHQFLRADGEYVGLPAGQIGNSEVGHLNIGAGRVVYQSLSRINRAIDQGSFQRLPEFHDLIEDLKVSGGALHLMGLLSDGGVHSHINHLYALMQLAADAGLDRVYLHAFLDGRDVAPDTGLAFLEDLVDHCRAIGVGQLATVMGRYYAMDRDQRWDRVERAYDAIVSGRGTLTKNPVAAVQASYQAGVYDEFVEPIVVVDGAEPVARLQPEDGVIFYNFRPDRAIQLCRALTDPDFDGFDRGRNWQPTRLVTMTPYDARVQAEIAFKKEDLQQTIGEVVSRAGRQQLRIAETEKYPHVTYFMSGGRHEPFPGETRCLIDSPKVATYDLQPEMSAYQVRDQLLRALAEDRYDLMIINFANPDMVGHSGLLEPTIRAVEAVDHCLGDFVDALLARGGCAVITADHGNAEEVVTLDGAPMTAHTTNPVPVIVTRSGVKLRAGGKLADLAPTLLDLLGIPQPAEMTGQTLIIEEGENEDAKNY